MTEIVDRLLPLLLENAELSKKGVDLLQKAHKQILRKSDADRTPEEWFVLGYYAQQVQQNDDALAHFTQAVLKNPEFEAAYKFRAMVCIDTQQFEDAEYDLNKALELDPSYTDARFERARMYHEMDEDKKAMAELKELIELDNEFADAYALLGSTSEKTGDYDGAIKAFASALELDPDNGHYLTQRGLAHYFAGNYELAEKDLLAAQKITGTNHITQFNMALVLSEHPDKVKDAYRSFEKAFKKAPDMLNHFYEQSGKLERQRLDGRLDGIITSQKAEEEKNGSQFYRQQLILLLERKLTEARGRS
ncbi:MAG: tetratricopeptide repeat protein [Bacteroidetes bacterium]|nr:tetratricopeptide repeat protein [Bacteroidota bacterium]MCH8523058.1 tetratricopeptide repeat protein [Balneolales bacterium]